MARKTPVQLVGGAYSDDALPWSAQDCVNYIPVFAEKEGTRSPKMLRGAPGWSVYCATMANSPIRGVYDCEGLLLAVAGNTLYSIGSDGDATSIGTIPGTERVTFAHNQVTGGHQVAIGNGQSGYVYDTSDSSFVQITDEGFPGFRSVDFIDQFIIGVEPFGRYWFHSDLSDATAYNTLDRYTAEKSPDLIQQVIATGGDVFALGQRKSQFFANTGATTGTFANRAGAEMDVGAASPWTACRLDNTVYWLGHDGTVYRLEGYQPRRVSTHALEQAFSRADLSLAYAYTFEDRGHKIYYLTVGGKTWGFDVATGEWHRRKSHGLDFLRFTTLTQHRRRWLGGDYTNGKLYLLDWAVQSEAGDELERSRISPVLHDDQNKVIVNLLELVFDTGMDESSAPRPVPLLNPLSGSGDLGDAYVGDSGTYQYTGSGGLAPRTFSIASGSLPTGATMDSAGLVTYAYTLAGSYSWTVRITDAAGDTVDVADTATISIRSMLLSGSSGASVVIIPSSDGLVWSAAPIATAGAANNAAYLTGMSGKYFGRSAAAAVPAANSPTGAAWTLTAGNFTAGFPASGGEDAYTNGTLVMPAHAANLQLSADQGLTATAGSTSIKWIVALNRTEGKLAGIGGSNVRLSTDTAATWTAGTAHGIQTVACGMTDGTDYYFGGATLTPLPIFKKVTQAGVVSTVTLPTLTGATKISAAAYGNGTKIIGTDNGLIAYDNGDGNGLRLATTTLAHQVLQLFWCGSHWIAVTSPTGGGAGAIYTSPTGDVWTSRSLAGAYALRCVAQIRS